MNITEDYVSFETAKLLKEKGFNEDSWFHYDTDGDIVMWGYRLNHPDDVPAWTQQMVMKWFREVHEIIPIILTGGDSQNPFYYWFRIDTVKEGKWKDAIYREDEKEFPTYEQACEAAIKYCLDNLI